MIAIYRMGATLPSPGVSYKNVKECIHLATQSDTNGVFTLLNLFSGGALLQLSVFALGIMPYITSSIILQLMDPNKPTATYKFINNYLVNQSSWVNISLY